MSGGDHTLAPCGCVLWDDGLVDLCPDHQRIARLKAAGVRPAKEGMDRADRVTVKRNPWWLALLLRWLP